LADVQLPEVLKTVTEAIVRLESWLTNYIPNFRPGALEAYLELVHDVRNNDVIPVFDYYFINHQNRTMFWAANCSPDNDHLGLPSEYSNEHKSLYHPILIILYNDCVAVTVQECQYWKHVVRFPGHIQLDSSLLEDIQSLLTKFSQG
jgi:hypothetical protein